MTVFKNGPAKETELVIKANETYSTPLLPGFELPLAQLLKVAADWTNSQSPRRVKKSDVPPK